MKFGIKMKLNIREYVQVFLYNYGAYELPTIKFFRNYAKKNMTIIDVGANVGYHTLILSQIAGETGKVFSFEPEINNLNLMKENIALNHFKNIEVLRKAASSQNGSIKLYLSNSDNLGVHSTVYCAETLSKEYEEIEAVRLDDFAKENNIKVDFVKIDVEGAETDVLAGMDTILKTHRPILVVELVEKLQKLKGLSTASVKKELFEKYQYQSYKILDSGEIEKLDINTTQDSDNVVFLPLER